MLNAIQHLHDATLLQVRVAWDQRSCEFVFAGAPTIRHSFALEFNAVTELVVPMAFPWGASVSVLEASEHPTGRFSFAMQSGDTISVVASNYVFKPTAEEVARIIHTPSRGGGLTRR